MLIQVTFCRDNDEIELESMMGNSEMIKKHITIIAFLVFLVVPTMSAVAPNVSTTSGVAPLAVWCDADVAASTDSSEKHEIVNSRRKY